MKFHKHLLTASLLLLLPAGVVVRGADVAAGSATQTEVDAFKARLSAATAKHLNLLSAADGTVGALKGKSADGQGAMAFYLMFEITGEQKFRTAALGLIDRVLRDMRETKFGVLEIKEKEKPGGETINGGGPPAFGFYTAGAAYVLRREGGREEDLKYLATVLDRYPWSEGGWWSADIDVKTGESKVPMTKPSPINKTASVAMAAAMVSDFIRDSEPEMAARLKQKADKCLYEKIIPAQGADGFWHYSLSDKDPKNKDILGYFMLTTQVLMELRHFVPAYREPRLDGAIGRAQGFAFKCIAPMTDPNKGSACAEHSTPNTPSHYAFPAELKRGFQLGPILLGGDHRDEGIKIMDAALAHFPMGNAGQDGVHAAEPSAFALSLLR